MRECVYGVSHLPIFSSTHKPLAYLLDIYYTRKAVFSQANSRQISLTTYWLYAVNPISFVLQFAFEGLVKDGGK